MPVQAVSTAFELLVPAVVCLIVRSCPGRVVAWLGVARSPVGAEWGVGLCQILLRGAALRIPLSCCSLDLALRPLS